MESIKSININGEIHFDKISTTITNATIYISVKNVTHQDILSTTLSKKTAIHFAFNITSGKGALLSLKVGSKNQKAILISENDEEEVLLPPKKVIHILNSKIVKGKSYSYGIIK